MQKPRGLETDWVSDFGPDPPPGRRPRSPGEGGQATRDRPPGTHARGKRSKEVYNYTSIQSIQYTLYSIQCTWVQYTLCKGYSIQYTGYKGIRVYSIQGTKGSGKRVYNVEDLARWAQALRIKVVYIKQLVYIKTVFIFVI